MTFINKIEETLLEVITNDFIQSNLIDKDL